MSGPYIRWLDTVTLADLPLVGGKAASLGELAGALAGTDAVVPSGFAVTAAAYEEFVRSPALRPLLDASLSALDHGRPASEVSAGIRAAMEAAPLPATVAEAVADAYRRLTGAAGEAIVAVRSSATLEDLPGASAAGQHASYLGVRGAEAVLQACRACFASAFTERAMAYRERMGLDHRAMAVAVAVHSMVAWPRCEAAGVMFTLDPETGHPGVIVVDGSWGVGEVVVQGETTPDEWLVLKAALGAAPRPIIARRRGAKAQKVVAGPAGLGSVLTATSAEEHARLCLGDEDVLRLAAYARRLEAHYGKPMDIEWAKDGDTGRLCIVQARPETVQATAGVASLRTVTLEYPPEPIARGITVGSGVGTGVARVVTLPDDPRFGDGDVLVAAATSPDWVPLMKRAAAIVTDRGGRTSHAAIVSRELGVPAVVGTGDGTAVIKDGQLVTVSSAEGQEGRVYAGAVASTTREIVLEDVPATRTRVMMNLSIPDAALRWWKLPADGVGLARIEFMIGEWIGAHPMALLHPERVGDAGVRDELAAVSRGFASGAEYFIDRLAEGIALLATSQHPKPVVVRLSDFKSNEYAGLLGGQWFEPAEPNPMLGLRGASRYYHERYREAFGLECAAIRRVREEMGLDNVVVMIPFCRTVNEADRVLAEMAANGLVRGEDGLKVWLMCEIPSNVILAREFARRVDGFSIGSNDLTQLVLGVDRDSAELRALFNERDEAVKTMIRSVIRESHEAGITVSFCGQAPTDDPAFAEFLVECGIDSVSVSPDVVVQARRVIAAAEGRRAGV